VTTATDEERAVARARLREKLAVAEANDAGEASCGACGIRPEFGGRVSLLILDTSAVVAFAVGSVDVGEPIVEVHDEGGRVLLPVVCLIEAARQVGDEMPGLLADHPACEVSPLTAELWPA
jgi:hypothetical protein